MCVFSHTYLTIQEVARLDHSKYDCLIVAILTHGENGMLMSCDGDSIPISDIIQYVVVFNHE